MPDFLILIVILFFALFGFVGLIAGLRREPAALIVALVAALGIGGLGKWWHWAASARQWSVVQVFPIQDIKTADGFTIQVFIEDSTIHNATAKWNRILPEGTFVRKLKAEPTCRGIRFVVLEDVSYELICPNEGAEDGS